MVAMISSTKSSSVPNTGCTPSLAWKARYPANTGR